MFKKLLFIVVASLLLLPSAMAQRQQTITGTVYDDSNKPLVGATVNSKGKENYTITTLNGRFELKNVSESDVVVVNFLGMIPAETTIGSRTDLKITMKAAENSLDEVVVVGYGVQKKATLTGAVSTLKTTEISNVASSNITQSMVGRIPGLTSRQWSGRPGDDKAFFKIRGGGDALIVIDGIIGRDLTLLDPNEIESMSVLKDAAATAVYGARGQNGVVLVTTKRGGSGIPQVSYNGYVGLQTPTRTPDFMTPKEKYRKLVDYYDQVYGVDFFDQKFYDYMETDPDGITRADGRKSGSTNFYKAVMRKCALQQNHNIAVSGGSDRNKYYVGAGVMTQDGIMKSDITYLTRYNLIANIDSYLLKDKSLKLSVDMNAVFSDDAHSWGENDANGFWNVIYGKGISERVPLQFSDGRYVDMGGYDNPLAMTSKEHGSLKHKKRNTNAKLEVEYKVPFVKGLSAKALFAYDYISAHTANWYVGLPLYTTVNQEVPRIPDAENQPTKSERADFNYSKNLEFHLRYERKFGNHNVGLLGVFSQNQSGGNFLTAQRSHFSTNQIEQIDKGDPSTDIAGGNMWESARRGFVGRANYAFKDKYLVEASFRYDGSENFASDRRWGFFPSLSVGWRISEEPFFKNHVSADIVDNIKLRFSVGQSGSDYLADRFSFLGTYSIGGGATFGENATNVNTAFEKRIPSFPTWQTTTSYNGGIDINMFKNTLSITADVFYARTVDILQQSDKSFTLLGAAAPMENIGRTRRGGFDLGISYNKPFRNGMFSVGVNATYWNSVVEYINEAEGTLMIPEWRKTYRQANQNRFTYRRGGYYQSLADVMNRPKLEGKDVIMPGDFYYEDLNGDGKIDQYDQEYNGYGDEPQFTGAMSFRAEWKGLYVSGLFTLTSMFSVYLSGNTRANAYMDDDQLLFNFREYTDVWTPANRNAKYPRLPYIKDQSYSTNVDSDYWYCDATSFRLKNLEIGYDFTSRLLKRSGISKLRVYLSGTNLFSVDNMDGFDPETANNGALTYPMMSVYSVGVNLTF